MAETKNQRALNTEEISKSRCGKSSAHRARERLSNGMIFIFSEVRNSYSPLFTRREMILSR